MVKNSDMTGTINSNPYFFRHYNCTNLTLKISSVSTPYSSGLHMDFKKNNYMEAYWTLFQNIQERSCDITYEQYKEGNTLFCLGI
jgi:hypothetical protein